MAVLTAMHTEALRRRLHAARGLAVLVCAALSSAADAQETLKSAVVALTDDAELRAAFERDLVERAIAHNYDAVTTYDLVPNIHDVGRKRFLRTLEDIGVRAMLIVRPAAVGAGSSIDAVRDELSPELFESIRAFAGAISSTGADDLIVVVHLAIYAIDRGDAVLISGGAVWLDEPVASRAEAAERLEDLIVANVDAARPAIRQRIGLPPLPPPIEGPSASID